MQQLVRVEHTPAIQGGTEGNGFIQPGEEALGGPNRTPQRSKLVLMIDPIRSSNTS